MTQPAKLKSGLINLKGKTFGHLSVLRKVQRKKPSWEVQCNATDSVTGKACRTVLIVAHNVLIRKSPKTHCGCQLGGLPKRYPKEYHAWWDAKSRCHNPKHPTYKGYGAKGIQMCQRWRESFEAFFEDIGPRPEGMSLDRIDPFGNYELYKPDGTLQCRWADNKTQARNKKDSKYVKHPKTGERILAAELAEQMKVTYQTLRAIMIRKGTWYGNA